MIKRPKIVTKIGWKTTSVKASTYKGDENVDLFIIYLGRVVALCYTLFPIRAQNLVSYVEQYNYRLRIEYVFIVYYTQIFRK